MDMPLTIVVLMGYMAVLTESAARCKPGDKRTTLTVEAEYRQSPLLKSYSNVKIITSNSRFQSSYEEYSTSQESYESLDTSASADVSYGLFSGSVSASYASVTQRASALATAGGRTTSGNEYRETVNEQAREYQNGYFQIMRDLTTTVTINGVSASVEEQQIISARKNDNPMTFAELQQQARDYISYKFGDQRKGEFTAGGSIFSQTRCYKLTGSPQIDGGGWKLVRHTPPGSMWSKAKDQLTGTDSYGTPSGPTSCEQWSIPFNNEHFNQFLFVTGDKMKWLIADKHAVTGGWYSNADRNVLKSSMNANPHTVKWYRRSGALEDPWISLTDHHDAIARGDIVYGENSFVGAHASNILPQHNGANVYIRMKRNG